MMTVKQTIKQIKPAGGLTASGCGGLTVRTHCKIGFADQAVNTPGTAFTLNPPLHGDMAGAQVMEPAADVVQEVQLWFKKRWASLPDWDRQTVDKTVVELNTSRFWELDAARGLAVVLMLTYHLVNGWGKIITPEFAKPLLAVFEPLKDAIISTGGTYLMGEALLRSETFNTLINLISPDASAETRKLAAYLVTFPIALFMALSSAGGVSFIFISGVAMSIRENRSTDPKQLNRDLVKRGLTLLALGAAISAYSLIVQPTWPVYFGILHLLGAAQLASIPAAWLSTSAAASLGLGIFSYGQFITPLLKPGTGLMWLGLTPFTLKSWDFVPFFPYLGIYLMGMAVGRKLYENGTLRTFALPDLSDLPVVRALDKIGRNALPIYMAQIPLAITGAPPLD